MITEDYCSFEVAKLLKEKGFDCQCSAFYTNEDILNYGIAFNVCDEMVLLHPNFIKSPTCQTAMKWLREVHGIFIAINNDDLDFNWQCYDLINRDDALDPEMLSESYAGYKTYENAVEAALKYALKNLI